MALWFDFHAELHELEGSSSSIVVPVWSCGDAFWTLEMKPRFIVETRCSEL